MYILVQQIEYIECYLKIFLLAECRRWSVVGQNCSNARTGQTGACAQASCGRQRHVLCCESFALAHILFQKKNENKNKHFSLNFEPNYILYQVRDEQDLLWSRDFSGSPFCLGLFVFFLDPSFVSVIFVFSVFSILSRFPGLYFGLTHTSIKQALLYLHIRRNYAGATSNSNSCSASDDSCPAGLALSNDGRMFQC